MVKILQIKKLKNLTVKMLTLTTKLASLVIDTFKLKVAYLKNFLESK